MATWVIYIQQHLFLPLIPLVLTIFFHSPVTTLWAVDRFLSITVPSLRHTAQTPVLSFQLSTFPTSPLLFWSPPTPTSCDSLPVIWDPMPITYTLGYTCFPHSEHESLQQAAGKSFSFSLFPSTQSRSPPLASSFFRRNGKLILTQGGWVGEDWQTCFCLTSSQIASTSLPLRANTYSAPKVSDFLCFTKGNF